MLIYCNLSHVTGAYTQGERFDYRALLGADISLGNQDASKIVKMVDRNETKPLIGWLKGDDYAFPVNKDFHTPGTAQFLLSM